MAVDKYIHIIRNIIPLTNEKIEEFKQALDANFLIIK